MKVGRKARVRDFCRSRLGEDEEREGGGYRGGALPSILPTGADVSNESMAVVELPKAASIDRSASFFLSSLFLDSVLLSLRALDVTSTQQRRKALYRGWASCRSSKKEALAKASGSTAVKIMRSSNNQAAAQNSQTNVRPVVVGASTPAVARVSPAFQSRGRHSSFPADPSHRVQTVRSVGARRVLLRWSRRCTDQEEEEKAGSRLLRQAAFGAGACGWRARWQPCPPASCPGRPPRWRGLSCGRSIGPG